MKDQSHRDIGILLVLSVTKQESLLQGTQPSTSLKLSPFTSQYKAYQSHVKANGQHRQVRPLHS